MNAITKIILLMVLATSAQADTWLNLGGISYHEDRRANLNERNHGLGIRYDLDANDFISAGVYRNSINRVSRYAVYGRDVYTYREVKLGAIVGVVDGYKFNNGGVLPMVAPYLSFTVLRVGFDVVYVPKIEKKVSAVIGLQMRVRL